MGNAEQTQHQQHQPEQNTKRISNHRYALEIRDRQIILDYQNKIKITIGDILSFPAGGFQGLHLWDSNIELARYILKNRDIFAGKSVIQLLSGTGIGAITVKKYTKASKIAATDKSQHVTINIGKNCQKNNINQGMIVACISWSDYKQFKTKFDFVIGADVLYKGCPAQQLINSLDRLLNVGGKAIFVIPYKNQQDSTNKFIKMLDNNVFSLKRQKLIDQIYMQSPLLNQVLGYQQFKQISEGIFHVYMIQKIKQTQNTQATIRQKTNTQTSQTTKPLKRRNTQPKKQPNLPTNQPPIQIKNQVITHPTQQQQRYNQQRIKRQLVIFKINKQEDKPAYIRNKKKSITQMIAQSQQHKIPQQGQGKICNKVEINQVQMVRKQHDLYKQPIKKAQCDKNSFYKTIENQDKGDI